LSNEKPTDFVEDKVRSAEEIATRAIVLFAVVGVGLGANRAEVWNWLNAQNLAELLTPRERSVMEGPEPTRKQLMNAGWQSEALFVLLWALQKIEELPPANAQCNTSELQAILPPYAEISVRSFIQTATRRSDNALVAMADEMLDLHWRARDAAIHNRAPPHDVNIEIIQERHHGINWVIGYDGAQWDEVTTDT
jgi:hypothetical protein